MLTNDQKSKLAQTLSQEFTAAAKNDLLAFADCLLGFVAKKDELPKAERAIPTVAEVSAIKAKAKG